jgi:hypothetical protein
MSLEIVDGPTIPAGESLSDGADCSEGGIVRITIPQEYTKANLTFQVSTDGNFYNDVFDVHGNEITVAAQPNSAIIIHERWTKSVNWIKFRSGTRTHPVAQQVDCKFAIAIDTDEAPPALDE